MGCLIISLRFLQPPANIQKGQRGAKPHSRIAPLTPPLFKSNHDSNDSPPSKIIPKRASSADMIPISKGPTIELHRSTMSLPTSSVSPRENLDIKAQLCLGYDKDKSAIERLARMENGVPYTVLTMGDSIKDSDYAKENNVKLEDGENVSGLLSSDSNITQENVRYEINNTKHPEDYNRHSMYMFKANGSDLHVPHIETIQALSPQTGCHKRNLTSIKQEYGMQSEPEDLSLNAVKRTNSCSSPIDSFPISSPNTFTVNNSYHDSFTGHQDGSPKS